VGERGTKGTRGDKGDTGATGAAGAKGEKGFDGWTPVLSIVSRGASDHVLQVVNWTNPNPLATNKPTFPMYIGATGFTSNIADAVNIKGSQGLQGLQGIQGANGLNGASGTNGWSPVITLRKDTLTNLVYFYLASWVGGTGTQPTTIGYISQDGITPEPVAGSDVGSLPMTVSFSNVTDKPTDLAGYGIVDTYTKTETDTAIFTTASGLLESVQAGNLVAIDNTDTQNPIIDVTVTKADVGLSNVDNTSDLDKPISTATQTALDLKADTSSLSTVANTGDYTDLINTPPISFLSASGSPEGVVTASIPAIYIDSINGNIYTKTTNATNTDWKLVTLT